jgi:uncharacterized SAM-binding protein YcdF (DUF218 family)
LRRRLGVVAVVCLVLAVLLFVTHSFWLGLVGEAFESASAPEKADAALVLAGDSRGYRITTAAELVKAGYVPRVLVSSPVSWYGVQEGDLAVHYAAEKGYPREWFEPLYINALSTEEEAREVTPELQKRGIHKLLIVTSNFHTRRAGKIFRRGIPDSIEIRMISAPDKYFASHSWWHTREGWKTVFFEASKTLAGWAGI